MYNVNKERQRKEAHGGSDGRTVITSAACAPGRSSAAGVFSSTSRWLVGARRWTHRDDVCDGLARGEGRLAVPGAGFEVYCTKVVVQ